MTLISIINAGDVRFLFRGRMLYIEKVKNFELAPSKELYREKVTTYEILAGTVQNEQFFLKRYKYKTKYSILKFKTLWTKLGNTK